MTELETESESEVIQKVEVFIQRCHDLDYVFTPESRKMVVQNSEYGASSKLWANVLAASMTEYTRNKLTANRLKYALTALANIDRALVMGLVTEGPGLIRRHAQAEAKVKALESENKRLSNENYHLSVSLDQMKDAMAA